MTTTNRVHPVEEVALDGLTPHPENYKRHPREQVDEIVEAIRRHGWTRSLVVTRWRRRTTILAGHAAATAAREVGLDSVTATVLRIDPSSPEALAVLVGDNETAWLAETDAAQLAKLGRILAEHQALPGTGLTEERLAGLEPADSEVDLTGYDDAPPAPTTPDSEPGRIYELGRHRLLCGDATDPDALHALFGDHRAHCMWTDPPYGVNYVGGTDDHLTITNDQPDGLDQLLRDAFTNADAVLRRGAAVYIAHPAGPLASVFTQAIRDTGWRHRQSLVWDKGTLVLGHSDYHYDHEPILYANTPRASGRFGRGSHGWYGDDAQTTVFRIPKPARNAEHPTMKPVELVGQMIRNSTPPTGIVLDPFAGSGSTLIAADILGRTAYLVELDPTYCDVIRQRWDDHHGSA